MEKITKKESPKSIKVKGNLEQWAVSSYTGSVKNGDLALAGTGAIWCYSEKPEHLDSIRKALTLDDVILINRQKKTDFGNGLRVEPSVTKNVKALQKAEPELVGWMIELQKQKLSGKVDPELVKKIQAKLTA